MQPLKSIKPTPKFSLAKSNDLERVRAFKGCQLTSDCLKINWSHRPRCVSPLTHLRVSSLKQCQHTKCSYAAFFGLISAHQLPHEIRPTISRSEVDTRRLPKGSASSRSWSVCMDWNFTLPDYDREAFREGHPLCYPNPSQEMRTQLPCRMMLEA